MQITVLDTVLCKILLDQMEASLITILHTSLINFKSRRRRLDSKSTTASKSSAFSEFSSSSSEGDVSEMRRHLNILHEKVGGHLLRILSLFWKF